MKCEEETDFWDILLFPSSVESEKFRKDFGISNEQTLERPNND